MKTEKGKTMNDLDKEYEENSVSFITDFYKDGELLVSEMNNTDVLSFNIWSLLTHTDPEGVFDEVRVRVATPEEVKAWDE